MTIETYAKQLGITATAEQLEKLKQYMQHKPKVGETYLLPCTVRREADSADEVWVEFCGEIGKFFDVRYFTPDRLAPNHPVANQPQGLTAKFKVGQKVRPINGQMSGEICAIYPRYTVRYSTWAVRSGWAEDELKAVED